jgi:hypothetical protein
MEAAAAAGVELPEIGDSGITDDDMWPEWTEDSMDEDERSFAIAL